MQLSISAQHIKLGDGLNDHIKDKISEITAKYLEDNISTHVYFTKQRTSYNCRLIVTIGHQKQVIKSEGSAHDIHAAFDWAIAKLQLQLRKYKSKLKNHNKDKVKPSTITGLGEKYVIAPDGAEQDMKDNPVIVAEKSATIAALSVSEAVMKMDLEHLPAVIFFHGKTGRVNVVYYRGDGNISWVDSQDIVN
jgi:ribosomal subunit interface protein